MFHWKLFVKQMRNAAMLAEMRARFPNNWSARQLKKELLETDCENVLEGIDVKLLAKDEELYVMAKSKNRVHKGGSAY